MYTAICVMVITVIACTTCYIVGRHDGKADS
jgi:hypothetical protein